MLIFNLDTLMNLLFLIGFSVCILQDFIYIRKSHHESKEFTSTFPISIPYISFSFLLALARTSSAVLNRSDKKREILFIFLTIRRKSFILKYHVSWRFFIDALYRIEEIHFYFQSSECFYHEGGWVLSNIFYTLFWTELCSLQIYMLKS